VMFLLENQGQRLVLCLLPASLVANVSSRSN
jgi:hypothetical protein